MCVTDWLFESGRKDQLDFEELPPEEIADLLCEFYYAVRKQDGNEYSKSALKGIRAGLQRYLEGKPFFRKFSLSRDSIFNEANTVFDGYIAKLKKDGKDIEEHKEEIPPEDERKLYDCVFTDTPQGLLYRVFFEVVKHFGRRGRENLRNMTPAYFTMEKDGSGLRYYRQPVCENDKNHTVKKKGRPKKGVIAEIPGDKNCPFTHVKDYLEKRNKDCPAFFQKAHDNYWKDGIWYENSAVGKNLLNGMMKKMSEVGNLSKIYTNHCIRKTVITRLDDFGFQDKDIMSVTGHKYAASLGAYLDEPSLEKKQLMSRCLQAVAMDSVKPRSVTGEVGNRAVEVSCGAARAALPGTSSASLPPLPALPGPSTGTKRKRQVTAALGVCPPSPEQHTMRAVEVSCGAAQAALSDTSSVLSPPLPTIHCPSTARKQKRKVTAAVGVCPPSPQQHTFSGLSVCSGSESTEPVVSESAAPAALAHITDGSVLPVPTLVNVQQKSHKSVSAALGMCPDSPVQDINVIGFEGSVFESVQQCSQSSVCEDGSTTNTSVSVQRRMTGSLLAGATFSNCTVNINVYK